jgi:hypothetical protein
MAESFRSFSQLDWGNTGIVTQIRRQPLPSIPFSVHNLFTSSFYSVLYGMRYRSVIEPKIHTEMKTA